MERMSLRMMQTIYTRATEVSVRMEITEVSAEWCQRTELKTKDPKYGESEQIEDCSHQH